MTHTARLKMPGFHAVYDFAGIREPTGIGFRKHRGAIHPNLEDAAARWHQDRLFDVIFKGRQDLAHHPGGLVEIASAGAILDFHVALSHDLSPPYNP